MTKTILAVDDHDDFRQSLSQFLRMTFQDCRILEAANGEEALRIHASERPGVILMDIRMPGQSGIETARRIKAADGGVPIVILTAHDHPQYRIEAAGAGATAYVLKEMIGKDLVPLLRSLLEMVPDQ